MGHSESIVKMTEAMKSIFEKRFIRFGENLYNSEMGYVAIEGTVSSSDMMVAENKGYTVTLIEARDKNALIVHVRPLFEAEKKIIEKSLISV